MTSKLELLGREFWCKYIDVDDQVERLVRKAAWEDLLERVYDKGYDEGHDDGYDSGWDDREMGGAE